MNTEALYDAVVAEWERWPKTKHVTEVYGFSDLLKLKYGFTMSGRNKASFNVTVVDEKKFAWFLLGGRVR